MGRIFGILGCCIIGLSIASCATSKTVANKSTLDPYSDSLVHLLKNKGWPDDAVAIFKPFKFEAVSYSIINDTLSAISDYGNDVFQKVWYDEGAGLYLQTPRGENRRLCLRRKTISPRKNVLYLTNMATHP